MKGIPRKGQSKNTHQDQTRPLNFPTSTHPLSLSSCGTASKTLAEQEETRTTIRTVMCWGESVKLRSCHSVSDLCTPSPRKEEGRLFEIYTSCLVPICNCSSSTTFCAVRSAPQWGKSISWPSLLCPGPVMESIEGSPGRRWRWPTAESQNSSGQELYLLCLSSGWTCNQRCAFPGCFGTTWYQI